MLGNHLEKERCVFLQVNVNPFEVALNPELMKVKKCIFSRCHLSIMYKNDQSYQDRLGTNIGKAALKNR